MNLNTRQMKAFLQVARAGSFTRAAEHIHMTQAGLSVLVREVERQLGARLFDRTTRAVVLTDAGKRFAKVAESVLRQLDDAAVEVDALGALARGQLRIAATPLVSSQMLPGLLGRFHRSHSHVHLQLLDGSLAGVQDMVESGVADMGLGFFFTVNSGLVRKKIAEFALMKITAADAPAKRVGRTHWTSVQRTPLISLPQDNPIQRLIDTQLARLHIEPIESSRVNFFATMIAMVEAGFGSAIIPTFAVAACRRHHVRLDLLVEPRLAVGFYRIARRGAARTDAMAAFDDMLAESLPEMTR